MGMAYEDTAKANLTWLALFLQHVVVVEIVAA